MNDTILNNLCAFCSAPQEIEHYRFCGIKCQWLYVELREKTKMNHQFVKSTETGKCEICQFDYLSHTPAARCQSCNKCAICNVIDSLLLCDSCAEGIKSKQFDLIQQSRKIDSELRGNQDFHNAATIPIIELKKAIIEDSSITNKDEALKAELLTRYEQFSARIFELNSELLNAQLSKSIIRHNLDELAHIIRNEERERIKIADANYIPPIKKPVKARVVKASSGVTKNKFDEAVSNFVKLNNCSETEARLTIIQFYQKMGKEIPQEYLNN